MKKEKLDKFDVRLLISSLYQTRDRYSNELRNNVDGLILRLIDEHESMKPCRRRKILFQPSESSLAAKSLILWRNDVIEQKKPTEDIDRLLLMFGK